jgi:hypothetical protein
MPYYLQEPPVCRDHQRLSGYSAVKTLHFVVIGSYRQTIDQPSNWGFAVRGAAASVLGSMLVPLVAFAYGFTAALMLGGLGLS